MRLHSVAQSPATETVKAKCQKLSGPPTPNADDTSVVESVDCGGESIRTLTHAHANELSVAAISTGAGSAPAGPYVRILLTYYSDQK